MADLTLDVWQFVRLMVGMEDTLNAHGGGRGSDLKKLYDKWEDLWVDLDARLIDLGKHDMDAFADLMMDQEVVLEEITPREKELVAQELEKVLRQIKARLTQTDDPGEVEDLSFERDELVLTIRSLTGKAPAPGKGAAGKAPGAKRAASKSFGGKSFGGRKPGGKTGPGKPQR